MTIDPSHRWHVVKHANRTVGHKASGRDRDRVQSLSSLVKQAYTLCIGQLRGWWFGVAIMEIHQEAHTKQQQEKSSRQEEQQTLIWKMWTQVIARGWQVPEDDADVLKKETPTCGEFDISLKLKSRTRMWPLFVGGLFGVGGHWRHMASLGHPRRDPQSSLPHVFPNRVGLWKRLDPMHFLQATSLLTKRRVNAGPLTACTITSATEDARSIDWQLVVRSGNVNVLRTSLGCFDHFFINRSSGSSGSAKSSTLLWETP